MSKSNALRLIKRRARVETLARIERGEIPVWEYPDHHHGRNDKRLERRRAENREVKQLIDAFPWGGVK